MASFLIFENLAFWCPFVLVPVWVPPINDVEATQGFAKQQTRSQGRILCQKLSKVTDLLVFRLLGEKQGKPFKKAGFLPPSPEIPGKEGQNAQNSKEIPGNKKSKEVQKEQGKEDQGWKFFVVFSEVKSIFRGDLYPPKLTLKGPQPQKKPWKKKTWQGFCALKVKIALQGYLLVFALKDSWERELLPVLLPFLSWYASHLHHDIIIR